MEKHLRALIALVVIALTTQSAKAELSAIQKACLAKGTWTSASPEVFTACLGITTEIQLHCVSAATWTSAAVESIIACKEIDTLDELECVKSTVWTSASTEGIKGCTF